MATNPSNLPPGQPMRPGFTGPSVASPLPQPSPRNAPGANALRDTLSPGRSLPFAAGLIPVPSVQLLQGAQPNTETFYYTLASFTPPQSMPDGSVLGFRVDMNSPWVSNGIADEVNTRYSELTGRAVAPNLKPYGSQYGTRCGLVIVTGRKWQFLRDDEWVKRRTHLPMIDPAMKRMEVSEAEPLGYYLRFPFGDMSPGAGLSMGRVERTLRDQPFAVRAQRDQLIFVALAIDAAYALAANGEGNFFAVINGELFIAPDVDERRIQNV